MLAYKTIEFFCYKVRGKNEFVFTIRRNGKKILEGHYHGESAKRARRCYEGFFFRRVADKKIKI